MRDDEEPPAETNLILKHLKNHYKRQATRVTMRIQSQLKLRARLSEALSIQPSALEDTLP